MLRHTSVYLILSSVLIATVSFGAVEPLPLSALWLFRADPQDVGRKHGWFANDLDEGKWISLSTHEWDGWEKQGHGGGADLAWYRTSFQVPDSFSGKKYVYLYFSGVDLDAWVWINGSTAGEHTLAKEGLEHLDPDGDNRRHRFWFEPFKLEIKGLLRPGLPNNITVRVRKEGEPGGGIWKPVHLFASDEPLEVGVMTNHANDLNTIALQAKEPTIQYDVWTTNPYHPVYPNTRVSGPVKITQEGTGESYAQGFADLITAEGTCGEYVPVALHVHNHSTTSLPIRFDLLGVHHEQHKLKLRSDQVQVHTMDYVLTRLKKLVPDPLPRADGANGLRLGPGETGSYFLLIDTRGMPAGRWAGRVGFTPLRNGPKLEIPFELNIAPVVLPQRVPIWVTFWSYSPSYGWGTEGRGNSKTYLDLMRRTGTNVVQMSYRDGGPNPILNENKDIVGINVSQFDRMMTRREFTHHDYLVVGLTIRNNSERWGPHFLEEDHEQWKRNFFNYTRMLAKHIRDNYGIAHDRWGLYLNDEHIGENFVPLGKIVKAADPNVQIWANRIEDLETTKKAEPYIDVIVPYSPWLSAKGLGFGKNAEAEKFFLKTGKPWWAYRHAYWRNPERTAFPRAEPNSPHDMLRSRPWLAWKLGLEGYGYWVFAAPRWWGRYDGLPDVTPQVGSPDHRHTNVGFIYMGHDGPITSRRLEAFRDGWEDYKLLWIIKQAASLKTQDSQLAQKALEHINSAVEDILSGATEDELHDWRHTLINDAAQLCAASPLRVLVTDVKTTRHSVAISLSSNQPIRVWTWLDRGSNDDRRFIDATGENNTPVVSINNLVPNEECKLIMVVGGPHGQQSVLKHQFKTSSW
ncbi:MAG: hypothetical protein CMJ20_11690 [Phycisphaeraceae bacterium]|nr:hypothetical protein [Phycisphaeraceae bacterium]|tara:strand:+ start:1891 stop:4458 length:2568 start_codon:yes stop_codon:yes gene_type:complete